MMIATILKKRKIFSLNRLYPGLLFFRFSKQKKEIWSQSAQEVILASAIIDQIILNDLPKRYEDRSLRQKIINYQDYIKIQIQISDEVRNRILGMFQTGIDLNLQIFHQTRMKDGLQKKPALKDQILKEKTKEKTNENQQQIKIEHQRDQNQKEQTKEKTNENQQQIKIEHQRDQNQKEQTKEKTNENQQQIKIEKNQPTLQSPQDNQILSSTLFNNLKKKKYLQSLKLNKFIFCPNYLVTRQIFDFFITTYKYLGFKNNTLISGNFGIAKSISIMLFIQLSYYIHKFLYQAKQNETHKNQFNKLKNKNLILLQIPKVFYYSVLMQELNLNIKDHILQQMPYLPNEDKDKLRLLNPQQFKQCLDQMYICKTQNLLVFDQINAVASRVRDWNFTIDQLIQRRLNIKFMKDADKIKEEQNIISKLYSKLFSPQQDRLQKVLQQINSLRLYVNKLVLNSSANIEQSLLGPKELSFLGKKGLGVTSHNGIQRLRLPFQKQLRYEIWAKIDFWHFFWFQITRRFFQNPAISKKFNQIKPKIIQGLFSSKQNLFEIKSYYRFLYVRQCADSDTALAKINQDTPQEKIIQIIYSFVQSFKQLSLRRHGQHLQNFINKNQKLKKQRMDFMLQLYTYAIQFQKKGINTLEIPINIPIENFQNQSQKKGKQNMQLFSKQLLTYDITDKKNVRFIISPKQFIQISTTVMFPDIKKYYPLKIFLDRKNRSMMGIAFQLYLINCFRENTQISFKFAQFKGAQSADRWKKLQIVDKKFRIHQQVTNFTPLNEKRSININQNKQSIASFSRNFKNLLDKCKYQPGKYFAAVPKIGQKVENSSASIDFAIGVFYEKKYRLFTFDATISKQKNKVNLSQKENNAKQLFVKCYRKEDSDIIIQHTILSPRVPNSVRRQVCQPLNSNQITITYSDLNEIEITNSIDQVSQGLFYELKKLLSEENGDNVDFS